MNVMFLEPSRRFPTLLMLFYGAYVLYALTTSDYVEGFSATRPWLWTPFRLATVTLASIVAYGVFVIRPRPFQTASYVVAAITGGIGLLFLPDWYSAFRGFAMGLPIGSAVSYGLLSGFFGALIVSRLFAAVAGFVALVAQVALDIVGYHTIVGYAGFH